MKYRYIFVDLDNTLLDFEAAEEYSFYYTAQSRGLSFGEAELERYQAINAPLWKMMERREITKDALVVRRFRELFEELGITGIDPEQYNADYLNNLALCTRTIDGAEELCRFIHENGVLIIATNGVSATQHRRIAASGLEPWLDKVVVSDDAGAEKPDPRYFERAFAVSGAGDKSECIIIGDSLTSDIKGGQQFGIDTCWFNPKGKALPEDMPAPTYTVSGLSEFIDILNGKDLQHMSEYRKELEKYLTMPNAHINCAENTSMALTDALGIGGGLEDARYMAAFGGGMGCGSVCGALIGAESALGRYMVSRLPEGSTPIGDSCPELRELAAQYHERFCQEFGSEFCRELKEGWVKGQPDGCKDLMRCACDLMEELLRERGL